MLPLDSVIDLIQFLALEVGVLLSLDRLLDVWTSRQEKQ